MRIILLLKWHGDYFSLFFYNTYWTAKWTSSWNMAYFCVWMCAAWWREGTGLRRCKWQLPVLDQLWFPLFMAAWSPFVKIIFFWFSSYNFFAFYYLSFLIIYLFKICDVLGELVEVSIYFFEVSIWSKHIFMSDF